MYARAAARPLSSEASAASAAMGEDDEARAGTCAATSHAGRTRSSMAPTTNVLCHVAGALQPLCDVSALQPRDLFGYRGVI